MRIGQRLRRLLGSPGRGLRALDRWGTRPRSAARAPRGTAIAARQIMGPFGGVFSGPYDQVEKSSEAYLAYFDRRLPPSTHVSERDRLRHRGPVPLSERAIRDWRTDSRTTDPRVVVRPAGRDPRRPRQ